MVFSSIFFCLNRPINKLAFPLCISVYVWIGAAFKCLLIVVVLRILQFSLFTHLSQFKKKQKTTIRDLSIVSLLRIHAHLLKAENTPLDTHQVEPFSLFFLPDDNTNHQQHIILPDPLYLYPE